MTQQNYQVLNQDEMLPGEKPIKAWTRGVEVEVEALDQLYRVSKLPFIHKHIAVMPDVHWGMGATVGSVIPTKGAIVPAAVGVDIGCGMMASRTTLTANDIKSLPALRSELERLIPHGRTNNGGPGDRGAWHDVPEIAQRRWMELYTGWNDMLAAHPKLKTLTCPDKHLGTLGSGNHFVEVCTDEQGYVWIMLHSGSRGIGNKIGTYFIELAKKDMERWFINLPDKDLAYIPEGAAHFQDYVDALDWAQRFAKTNREIMMENAKKALKSQALVDFSSDLVAINCHHNYVAKENHFGENIWVTRKGAVRAREGDLGIIPGSMGARSFIVRGLGNADSFHSCSHGAGRRMSRGEARRRFSLEDHIKATAGVECRKDADVIDETPAAYKDIDAVMAAQSDLVEVVHTLKQILCVKG